MHQITRSLLPSLMCLSLLAGVAAPSSSACAQATGATAGSKRLGVGDPAPALKVASWVKGEEIKGFEQGTAYVIDFWATAIGPCRKSIPHVGRLAAKYKDKGVKVIGVSIWEETVDKDGKTHRSPLPDIEKFVAEMGDKMGYSVAYGGDDAEMVRTWMNAANRVSIPSAFVVDKQGRIAWVGHPMEGLEETLEAVTSGSFDPKAAQDAATSITSDTAGPTNGGNGNGNGGSSEPQASATPAAEAIPAAEAMTDTPPVTPAKMGGLELGPACAQCGGMMQRTGACYTCSSCGYNTGCG